MLGQMRGDRIHQRRRQAVIGLEAQFLQPGAHGRHVARPRTGFDHGRNEGGELGYALSHAYGAVLDNPDLGNELEKKIMEKYGVGAQVDEPAAEPVNVDF